MSTSPLNRESEQGVALIVVLLLLAVMSGLATGMALNSQIEVAMSTNEMVYAGARAAAEAGLNRAVTAIVNPANNGENWLYGADGVAGTADDGNMGYVMATFVSWPETIGVTAQYSYTVEILDDDNNALYTTPLTSAQLAQMGEDGVSTNNINDRLVIRATGFGPSGTLVRVARLLESVDSTSPGTTTPSYSNPAILMNGDFAMDGNFNIHGLAGNVHSNGSIVVTGSTGNVQGDLTAVGTLTADPGIAVGTQTGGAPTINVPTVNAADYMAQADFFLNADGTMTIGSAGGLPCGAICNGWTFSGGEWSISGNTAPDGTFYVNGTVSISGSPGSNASPKALSIIATGSISVTGRPFLTPDTTNNASLLQFVTNGDLKIGGAVDVNAPNSVEGKCMVREQLHISGNPTLQGQIIVQNVTTGILSNLVTTNTLSGSEIEYNGSFDPINTPIYTPGVTTYVNAVSGWIE
ncbi:MAG: hypothetical protein Q7R30_22235 [Acidobacteriota bacterium]|nr:hypothetical protein [Acidobacteriota bacterium]